MRLPDGTYLYQNGSFHPINMKDGYWVAEKTLPESELQSGMVVGSWTDSETGVVHFDKVRLVRNSVRAEQLAVLWNQLAIWDNSRQQEVRV